MENNTVPAHLVELFEKIKYAIANRRQLVLRYGGLRREVCPHSLGWKNDHLACFVFQFAGESRNPLPPGGQWRCMHLHLMSNVVVREGDWHSGPIDPQSSSCIDEFEAYVGFPGEMSALHGKSMADQRLVDLLLPMMEAMDDLIQARVDEETAPLLRRIRELEQVVESLRMDSGRDPDPE